MRSEWAKAWKRTGGDDGGGDVRVFSDPRSDFYAFAPPPDDLGADADTLDIVIRDEVVEPPDRDTGRGAK
jgi:hypothetical protein